MSEVLEKPVSLRHIRVMDIMNGEGHSSFGWDERDDEWVIPMIQKKMDEGFVFWIVQRDPLREVQLQRVEDVRNIRNVIIKDGDSRILFEQGRIGLVAEDQSEVVRLRRARSAADAASNDTLAHRRPGGG